MRADRLISLIMLLQARNGLTAHQLALELEVTERTIYRDLISLNSAGIPVYTRSGPGGGCFLVEDYRTNLTGMSSEQVRALFALNIPSPLDQLGFSQDLKGALLKLSAALPASRREDQEQSRQRLYLDWGFHPMAEEQPHFLKPVQHAVWEDRLIKVRFRSLYAWWIDPVEQVAAPYSLVAWAGDWYLVCYWDGQGHVIRLSLVEKVELLTEAFIRVPGYDLVTFWLEWRHRYEIDRPEYQVKVRVSPAVLPFLQKLQPGPVDSQGWVTGRLIFETFEQARAKLLSYGGAVEVLEPEALRSSTLDFARQFVTLHGRSDLD